MRPKLTPFPENQLGNVAGYSDTGRSLSPPPFVERGIGECLCPDFESEVNNIVARYLPMAVMRFCGAQGEFPGRDAPVTWDRPQQSNHGTEDVSKAYLKYLYSEEALCV